MKENLSGCFFLNTVYMMSNFVRKSYTNNDIQSYKLIIFFLARDVDLSSRPMGSTHLCRLLDLFSQAIVQSGSPLSFWAVHNDSADLEDYVRRLSRHLSCDRPHIDDIVECLRTIHWNTLMSSVCAVRPCSFISFISVKYAVDRPHRQNKRYDLIDVLKN